jgi:hypothetical protein
MKPIRFPLNHFNFIVYSFQPAGMDGKPTMVENAIGITSVQNSFFSLKGNTNRINW